MLYRIVHIACMLVAALIPLAASVSIPVAAAMWPVEASAQSAGRTLMKGGSQPSGQSAAADVPRKEGSAWTLISPLGLHKPAAIDTLLYNYQRRAIPAMASDAYASTGNLGGAGINMIYFQRREGSPFFFDDALSRWLPTLTTQKLYNVYTPMTLASYHFAGNSQNHTDHLNLQFAANANRRVGVSAFMDFIYSKGCFDAQATKDISWGLGGYYLGDRYEMQTVFNMFNDLGKENGGITDDRFITDPATLQGGVNSIEPKTIPVRLSAAHNRISAANILSTHALKIGYWTQEEVNDTLTRDVYVPFLRMIYSLQFDARKHYFINTNAKQGAEMWSNHYFSPDRTADDTRYFSVQNTLGVNMLEGFRPWVKFGLSAYATLETRQYRLPSLYYSVDAADRPNLTPLPEGLDILPKTTQHLLWVGGRLDKTNGALLRYAADARFGMAGDNLGDIDLKGDVSSRFQLLGDSVQIEGHGRLSNLETPWLLRNYVSNHFAWQRNFGKVRNVALGGSLTIPWTRTVVAADVENRQNLVYFSSESLPEQYAGNIRVFAARVEQDFQWGIINWRNRLTYQVSSNDDILPLPALAAYSNLFIGFRAYDTLDMQIGVDGNWYSRYRPYAYQPALMTFTQQGADAVDVGNFVIANAYATAKIDKVRFFLLWSHFNAGWGRPNYFSLPHYPVDPSRIQFGLSIDFPD